MNNTDIDRPAEFKRRIPPAPMRERIQGCLLGGAVGDALGAPVASESGEASNFIRVVAETAFIADLENCGLLPPVLLRLNACFQCTNGKQNTRQL